jgi:hypothetical protein
LDDVHQDALDETHRIQSLEFDYPTDLNRIFTDATEKTSDLLIKLQWQQDVCPNPTTARLIVNVKDLRRDIPRRVSTTAFTDVVGEAEAVRQLWYQEELLGLAKSLYAEVELLRVQFFADRKQRQLLDEARKKLDSAQHICKLAIKYDTGAFKQAAVLLRLYSGH